jgi:putative FmdB family regulatory protein
VPTYGYRCERCGHEFDVWQRMTDDAKADCPVCGSGGRRLFFPAGILFKGTGFYKTDSRKPASSSASSSSSTSSPPSTPSTPPSTSTEKPPASSAAAAAPAD